MSYTTSSSAAVQSNANTKPSQAQQKRARKQASKDGKFNLFDDIKPKSQVVGDFHMHALMAHAQAEKDAAAAAKSSAIETSKEVKMKDAPLPPELVLPFAGVAATPSGHSASPGSRKASSTFSATSFKSTPSSVSTASRNSRGPAARPSGPWGNNAPYTHPAEGKQTTPPPTKASSAEKPASAAPSADEDGWIEVTSKNASKNAAPVDKTPAPVVDVDEAPKISRRQKKKEAAALAAALAVPDVSPPVVSSVTSTLSPETAPKQQEKEWSTVASKKPGKKAPVPAKDPYIWNELKSAVPEIKVTGHSKKNKAPVSQTDAHFPALEPPKIQISPLPKPSNAVPAKLQLPKPVAILKITKNITASKPTEKSPPIEATPAVQQLDNLTELTGPALDTVKSTPEPVVLETTPTPMVASSVSTIVLPTPVVPVPKKKKSGAAQKKAKKALAAAEALAAEVAMAKPAATIQQPAAVQVAQVDLSIDEDISSAMPETAQKSTVSEQTIAADVQDVATSTIHETSSVEDNLPVVPETAQELTFTQQVFEEPAVTTVSLESLANMVMSDDRFCLQFGFDDVVEDGYEALATGAADSWVPTAKLKVNIVFVELNSDVLQLCEIVQAEIFGQQDYDGESCLSLVALPFCNPSASTQECQFSAPSSAPPESITIAPTDNMITMTDIRVNQLHMGGISISEIIEGVAREDITSDTHSKDQVAKVFISCANREREMIGLAPSLGTTKPRQVLHSLILQNIARIGRTKLVDFLALLDFEDERTTLPSVVQACIVSAEKEIASRGTTIGKTVAKALGSYMESKM